MNTRTKTVAAATGAAALLAAATAAPPAWAQPAGQAARTLDDVQQATLFITARGRYWDYDAQAQKRGEWTGSGFLIDPSGLAVTNNHVVAGASSVEAYIGGAGDPINARVIGRSECSDLAVIKLDGSDFAYLDWYTGTPKVGLSIYAAGFPLSEPQYDLQDGIVSKARAGGDTQWASIKQVLQHSATMNPGNSGGPLVTADGQVVGVNYRTRSATSNQYFAIARDEALPLIKVMREGKDVDTVGASPEADVATIGGERVPGLRVTAIQSGSPADQAGLQPGDFIYEMEGVPLAEDGTLREFCAILRSQRLGDPIAIKVYRGTTGELLAGQFNGRTLAATAKAEQAQQEQPQKDVPAGDASLELVNESGVPIAGLNLVSPDAAEWGDSVLGDLTIDAGDSYTLQGIAAGTYDVRALDADGKSLGAIYNVTIEGDQKWTVLGLANLPDGAKLNYEDDFSDASKWEPASDDFADYAVQDEKYVIAVKSANRLAWDTYTPFKISAGFAAEVKCQVDKDGGLCGIGLAADDDDLLWLQVDPARQEYSLQHLKAGEWQPNLVDATTSAYIAPTLSNSIALSRVGRTINVYLNGTLVDSVESNVIPRGSVIFGGGTISDVEDVVVSLDDLTIWQVR